MVVSRLLFPGNSTSFTNYPLRARARRTKVAELADVVANAAPTEKGDGAPRMATVPAHI